MSAGLIVVIYYFSANIESQNGRAQHEHVPPTGSEEIKETPENILSAGPIGADQSVEADSDSVRVNWRVRQETSKDWSDYPDTYEGLRALAEAGDGIAAALLANRLARCNSAPPPQSNGEIDAAIDEMRRTHLVPNYRDGVKTIRDFNNHPESLDSNIEIYEDRARKCGSINLSQRAEWEKWLDYALAMDGNMVIILDLLYASLDEDVYSQLLNDMWNSGDPMALLPLSALYSRDYHLGLNPEPTSLTRYYAYQQAMLTLILDYHEEFDIPLRESSAANSIENELSYIRRQMHAHAIREAEELAIEIIERNRNCCLVLPDYLR